MRNRTWLMTLISTSIARCWTEGVIFRASNSMKIKNFERSDGYRPEFDTCENGDSCAACGEGFENCIGSTDSVLFCFNPSAGQICCPNGQGRSCDGGYYCAEDGDGEIWCCPEELDLDECASSYSVPSLESMASLVTEQGPTQTAQTAATHTVILEHTVTVGQPDTDTPLAQPPLSTPVGNLSTSPQPPTPSFVTTSPARTTHAPAAIIAATVVWIVLWTLWS